MGGIGIIGMALLIFPSLRVGGMALFHLESSDRSGRILPRVGQLSAGIVAVYLSLTLLCTILYYVFGMSLFDAVNRFHGCIAGIHELLRRQGLLDGRWCLDPDEGLSPGQLEEIERVAAAYPHLTDEAFVRENVDRWLAG